MRAYDVVVNPKRVRLLSTGSVNTGPVIYWMSRDQRVNDNWAFLFAQQLAFENGRGLAVIFNLVPEFLNAMPRQYNFMLEGLKEVEQDLCGYNIPFRLLSGHPGEMIPAFTSQLKASALVTDFDPLRIKTQWKQEVKKKIDIPFYEVDAHNIVPAFFVSGKQEYAAYTIRPKILKHLPEFLEEFPLPAFMKRSEAVSFDQTEWDKLISASANNKVELINPGSKNALSVLREFLQDKLEYYNQHRNDPCSNAQSGLSPYLHFGQLSAQRTALEVQECPANKKDKEAYLEQLIVRRELSDNFCFYNSNYDSFDGFPAWGKESLLKHSGDKREFNYTLSEFKNGETHEDLWNAAQKELLITGKMHGYMRMYWAKKILEWSKNPAEAMATAIYLNDRYSLDGRDPNGYAGCAWAIGGVHDRPWFEREIFGNVRYMNYNGAKKKFDIEKYTKKFAAGK